MHSKGICRYKGDCGGAIKMKDYGGVKHITQSKLKTRVFHGIHIMEEYL